MRADLWLWSARFFKQRKLAAEACTGGHVHTSGHAVKPGAFVRVGQELEIRNEWGKRLVRVTGLSERRLSAPLAQQLYEVLHAEPRPSQPFGESGYLALPSQRPDKRDRRQIERFWRESED